MLYFNIGYCVAKPLVLILGFHTCSLSQYCVCVFYAGNCRNIRNRALSLTMWHTMCTHKRYVYKYTYTYIERKRENTSCARMYTVKTARRRDLLEVESSGVGFILSNIHARTYTYTYYIYILLYPYWVRTYCSQNIDKLMQYRQIHTYYKAHTYRASERENDDDAHSLCVDWKQCPI